jgi:hypothetical protein
VLSEFSGYTPIGTDIAHFVRLICSAMPGVSAQAVWDSVHHIAGNLLTEQQLITLAWRLAGNTDRLRDGIAVPPWTVQHAPEWMPAQIMLWRTAEDKWFRDEFVLQVLAGTACPCVTVKRWSRRSCYYIASQLGYSRRRGKRPVGFVSELVRLRLWLHVTPAECRDGLVGFDDVTCTTGLMTWNRQIIKKRFREEWNCPHGYTHRCFQCPVGYDQCPAATHRVTDNELTESGDAHSGA